MWTLVFRLINGGGLPVERSAKCNEDELQSVKEVIAMDLEFWSGSPWTCHEIRRGR